MQRGCIRRPLSCGRTMMPHLPSSLNTVRWHRHGRLQQHLESAAKEKNEKKREKTLLEDSKTLLNSLKHSWILLKTVLKTVHLFKTSQSDRPFQALQVRSQRRPCAWH